MNDNPNIPTVRSTTAPWGMMYMMTPNDTIQALEAENRLMNELVKDQAKTIENLKESVNRLCQALIAAGVNATTVRNIASG